MSLDWKVLREMFSLKLDSFEGFDFCFEFEKLFFSCCESMLLLLLLLLVLLRLLAGYLTFDSS